VHDRLLHERERDHDAVQRNQHNAERLVIRLCPVSIRRLELEHETS
jgi:hypothetical protein